MNYFCDFRILKEKVDLKIKKYRFYKYEKINLAKYNDKKILFWMILGIVKIKNCDLHSFLRYAMVMSEVKKNAK